ncbi:hypothetical protein R3P38DRAFT_2761465 [Favolaschia claudopus]|uniref:Uncharacterized protein n=1 Tax=Favolaschia claudopus TaxID=2862362 RepID=A0AAW0DQK7_9AGAR
MDDSPRPQKRARTTPPSDDSPRKAPENQLHGAQLLLALPSLLVHPPTNVEHKRALHLSLLALRRCLGLQNPARDGNKNSSAAAGGSLDLSQPDECLEGGFTDEPWAFGIEHDIEKALGKALPIAQKHPSLASYPPYLTRLSARAAPHRARQLLRPSASNLGGSAIANAGGTTSYYYTHLAWADYLLQAMLYPTSFSPPVTTKKQPRAFGTPVKAAVTSTREKETQRDLAAMRSALSPLLSAPHANVVLLARVIELRAFIALGRWTDVGAALERAESVVGIAFTSPSPPDPTTNPDPPLYTTSPFHAALVVHILVLGIVWFTYSATPTSAPTANGVEVVGKEGASSSPVSVRLALLYTLLDAGVYNGKCRAATMQDGQPNVDMGLESEGILEVPLDRSTPPLYIRTTHPRVLYVLGYLISAVARRDLVGRKPKRKTFVLEGLGVVDREAQRELRLPRWATAGDVQAVEGQMAKLKADLMCELIAVSIMRSEFDDAERTLDAVIAHARNHSLFGGALAHRITLLHAQLAHALGRAARARTCYRVAAALADDVGDTAGAVAARAGEIALFVGMRARAKARAGGRSLGPPLAEDMEAEGMFQDSDDELAQTAKEVVVACRGLGGAMRAVGEVLEGVLTLEILKAKQHFKNALGYATECQDNHLRALILALIASHYLHTAGEQAQKMLATCEQLAAGLGAPGKKGKERADAVGNAPLRLWIGERFLEMHKRDGREDLIQKREEGNDLLRGAVVSLGRRGSSASDAQSTLSQTASTRHMLPHTPLEPPRAPFASLSTPSSSRSNSPGPSGSSVSLQINYVPVKFSSPAVHQRLHGKGKAPITKLGGGVDAFRAGESRMPASNERDYDGVDVRGKSRRKAKWNRFKWVLVCSNTVYTSVALAALGFTLTTWLGVQTTADVVRVGNHAELILTTLAASTALLTSLIGWAGILLNNRGFLAVYTFLLWISFIFLVIPGYITYKKFTFNLDGKISKQWSREIGGRGRLRIQNQLKCCGFFNPFVEATLSTTCYSRSVLQGCKEPYLDHQKRVLQLWFTAIFSCVPITIAAIVAGLLCSNHITYRFGKGMMPKAYRLNAESMAQIMDSYATRYTRRLAEEYGSEQPDEVLRLRSRSLSTSTSDLDHQLVTERKVD